MPVDVLVPPLGTTVDTLTLISWYKQEGEAVVKDEPLFLVETDKATLDVEAPASGILSSVSAGPGDEVGALTRIATIRAAEERGSGVGGVHTEQVVGSGGKGAVEDGGTQDKSYKPYTTYKSNP